MQDTLKYLGTRDMQVRVVIFPKSRIETPSGVKTTKKNQKNTKTKTKNGGFARCDICKLSTLLQLLFMK